MTSIGIVARKEIKDFLNNKFLLAILGLLLVLTVVSLVFGAFQVHSQISQYNKSISFLKSLGKTQLPVKPKLNPLAVSKDFVHYVGIIGALLAIILGNYTIEKERQQGTLKIILSRPIFRDQLLNGKILGNLLILASISLVIGMLNVLLLVVIGTAGFSLSLLTKLVLFYIITFLYMSLFFMLAVLIALFIPYKKQALLISIVLWLIFAFVLRQIGDTMDMDNQIPGGFFANMGVTRAQEKQIVSHFKFYETLRNGIEISTPTTHYHRLSYSLLGIFKEYIPYSPWKIIKLKWLNIVGLLIPNILLALLSYIVFLRRENIY